MLVRPRDRDVVCQARAWDMSGNDAVRIKMCMTPSEEDLFTIYHELGHDYYFLSYANLPYLFRNGAKYHIPANTPYTRYFLSYISYILQFQFQKALCFAAGYRGPLSECSVFSNKEAGEKFAKMLSLGASQPWQDTFQQLTGTRQIDASAIIEYFQPLMTWLEGQKKSQQCGWES
jgi:hypothetical protein